MDEILTTADTQPEVFADNVGDESPTQPDATLPSQGEGDGTLSVKFNKQTVALSREDATRYAQKGMKYDTVEPLLTKLREVAAREGKTLAAWVEGMAGADGGDTAVSDLPTDDTPDITQNQDAHGASDALAARLAEDYLLLRREVPEVGGFDTLPPDALREAVESGISLLDAYLRHEHREQCRVRAEQAAHSAAAEHSVGSLAAAAVPEPSSTERAMLRGVWG